MLKKTSWEKHCILSEQSRTKIDREPAFETFKFLMFWNKIRNEARLTASTPIPEILPIDVIRESKCARWCNDENVERWTPLLFSHASARVSVWHLASLAHIFLAFSDGISVAPIGRNVYPWRIWLINCSPTSLVTKVRLAFQVDESRAKIHFLT